MRKISVYYTDFNVMVPYDIVMTSSHYKNDYYFFLPSNLLNLPAEAESNFEKESFCEKMPLVSQEDEVRIA